MNKTKRGQVYYADLRPVMGSEQGGIRPCVIIQNDVGNNHSPNVIVAPITTKKKQELPTHVEITEEDKKFVQGTVLLEQIRTIDKNRMKNFICEFSENTMKKIDEALKVSLSLNKEEKEETEEKEMNELITVDFDTQTVFARELHKALGIEKRFSAWFESNSQGFVENEDFTSVLSGTVVNNGAKRDLQDYEMSVDMAKHICLMSRTEKGRECRQYLIDLEKAWNTPEQIFARALKMADHTINKLKAENYSLVEKIEQDKPKTIFADAVSTSKTSVLVGDLAKLICQNGVKIGQKRLFEWLRNNNYLVKNGLSRNMPQQRYVEQGLFEVKESTIQNPDGSVRITRTPKVTGKGQVYFVNKFLDNSEVGLPV